MALKFGRLTKTPAMQAGLVDGRTMALGLGSVEYVRGHCSPSPANSISQNPSMILQLPCRVVLGKAFPSSSQ